MERKRYRESDKQRYQSPELIVYGDVEDITLHTGSGANLDAGFTAGTPNHSLTFS